MPLAKSKGNMYAWVTHMHTHLAGECPHNCTYCYVKSFRHRVPKYQGPLRLMMKELDVDYGKGKTIFIEHCNDLFAAGVPSLDIDRVLTHCGRFPENRYVFQSKNPGRILEFAECLPKRGALIGTTIETNRPMPDVSEAPPPRERFLSMCVLSAKGFDTFVTVEPILDFDLEEMSKWIYAIRPEFVNVGADSKHNGMVEPSAAKIRHLLSRLDAYGLEVKNKGNLKRLLSQ